MIEITALSANDIAAALTKPRLTPSAAVLPNENAAWATSEPLAPLMTASAFHIDPVELAPPRLR